MLNGGRRWYVLTALALANLVLWVAIAGIVGLMVSDKVDLGFETLMRQGQATAVSVLEDVSEAVSAPTARPTATSTSVPAVLLAAGAQPEATSPLYRTPKPVSTAEIYVLPTATATPEQGQIAPSPEPEQGQIAPSPEPQQGQEAQSPAPTPTPVSAPLLLLDPAISSLTQLDSEMDRSATGRPVQIRYTEETLNREIAMLSQNNPALPFRNVLVDMQQDGVVVTGKVTVLGFQVDAKATGTVSVQDCLPQLEVEHISMSGVMTPRFVRDQVEALLLEAMSWYPADYPLCLEQIVLEETKATVYGYRR
jgi:hypothetical protein